MMHHLGHIVEITPHEECTTDGQRASQTVNMDNTLEDREVDQMMELKMERGN